MEKACRSGSLQNVIDLVDYCTIDHFNKGLQIA